MSIKCMTTVWEKSKMVGSKLLLLLAIADNADEAIWHAWPGMPTLAKKTRQTERTVMRQIPEIETAGEILVYREEGQVNHYLITVGRTPDEITASIKAFCEKLKITPDKMSPLSPVSRVPLTKRPGRGDISVRGTRDTAMSPESSTNHQSIEPSKNHQSSTPTDVDVPDDPTPPPSPIEHPEAYTVPAIEALQLDKTQWRQLLENEQKGLNKHGVRSGVVRHAQGKINQHPLDAHMPAMMEAVDKATIESINDPGMAAQFRRVIYDKLWQGAKPYMPEEVLRFAAENGPVESVYFLANALSRWRNKAARPQRASNIHPVQGSRPQIDTSSEAFKKEYGHYDRDDSVGYRD